MRGDQAATKLCSWTMAAPTGGTQLRRGSASDAVRKFWNASADSQTSNTPSAPDSLATAACNRHPATGQSDSLVIAWPISRLRVTSSYCSSAVSSKLSHPGLLPELCLHADSNCRRVANQCVAQPPGWFRPSARAIRTPRLHTDGAHLSDDRSRRPAHRRSHYRLGDKPTSGTIRAVRLSFAALPMRADVGAIDPASSRSAPKGATSHNSIGGRRWHSLDLSY